jgi:hypothetical protein
LKSKRFAAFLIAFIISCSTAIYYYSQLANSFFFIILFSVAGLCLEVYHVILAIEIANLFKTGKYKFRKKHLIIYAQYVPIALAAIMSTFMTFLVNIEANEIKHSEPIARVKTLEAKINHLSKTVDNTDKIYQVINRETSPWATIALEKQIVNQKIQEAQRLVELDKTSVLLADAKIEAFTVKSGFHLLADLFNAPGGADFIMIITSLFASIMLTVAQSRTVDGALSFARKSKKKNSNNQLTFQDVK